MRLCWGRGIFVTGAHGSAPLATPFGVAQGRRSIRWRGYDYSGGGAYFVTMCAAGRRHVFGRVDGAAMRPSAVGRIVEEEWRRTAEVRPNVRLDEFAVMPNHFHAILWIIEDVARRGDPAGHHIVGAQRAVPHEVGHSNAMPLHLGHRLGRFQHVIPGSLGAIIRAFKSASTKRINTLRGTPGAALWQRNYYKRVLRGRDELPRAQSYIQNNPMQWTVDRENPDRVGKPNDWEAFLYGDDAGAKLPRPEKTT